MSRVSVYDGKYTVEWADHVEHISNRPMRALRRGANWKNLCGDGLVFALAMEVQGLRERLGLDTETGKSPTIAIDDEMKARRDRP